MWQRNDSTKKGAEDRKDSKSVAKFINGWKGSYPLGKKLIENGLAFVGFYHRYKKN